jgi:ribosomal protein S18 acetylase RimI-like enzyme
MVYLKPIRETSVTVEALYALCNDAYRLWSDHGIDEPWMHRTIEEFKEAISDTMVFVALDADSEELLGMHCFRGNLKKRRAYGSYLAVSPKAFRRGVATRLITDTSENLRNAGFSHLIISTTVGAEWAVRCHLKNGFKLIGFRRAKSYNIDSYVFRKQIVPFTMLTAICHPVFSLYYNAAFCRCRYCYKYIVSIIRTSLLK